MNPFAAIKIQLTALNIGLQAPQTLIKYLLRSQLSTFKLTRFGIIKIQRFGITKLRRPLQRFLLERKPKQSEE